MQDLYDRKKNFLKEEKATVSGNAWSIDGDYEKGKTLTKQISKLMLRAFNGECEAAVSNVAWNNFETMKKRIERSFETINKLVERWRLALTNEYMELWVRELVLTHEYKERKEKEKEEQRLINARIREEERAQRELEKAEKEAEKEEERTRAALEEARSEMERARAEDAGKFQSRIAELEAALAEATAKKERALSMAQQTKTGYVYIISNIGSFGENVYKIGMTRRQDPMDRVRELGDASVPFQFDVHGMIYSNDAPKLEADIHQRLADKRVNLVNERKEFFHATIQEVIEVSAQLGVTVELTMLAEAKEYRQTVSMRRSSIRHVPASEQMAIADESTRITEQS